jgi:hypothetical protein
MKKNLFFFMAIVAMIFSSCEVKNQSRVYGDGNNDVIRDTIKINTTDTLKEGVELTCYTFDAKGNVVVRDAKGTEHVVSNVFGLRMETNGNKFFNQMNNSSFDLENETSSWEDDQAFFTMKKGDEVVTLIVTAKGSCSMKVWGKELFPCGVFSVNADIISTTTEKIDSITYSVATVEYTFYVTTENETSVDKTYPAARARQMVYAPVAVEKPEDPEDPKDPQEPQEPEKPEHERVVDLDGKVVENTLVVTGKVSDNLNGDREAETSMDLYLKLQPIAERTVYGTDFTFAKGGLKEVSETKKSMIHEDNGIKLAYDLVTKTFEQVSTASGETIISTIVVKFYDNFEASFEGKTESLNAGTLNLHANAHTESGVMRVGGRLEKNFTTPYQASFAGLTASENGVVNIEVNATYFEGEKIQFANRAVAFVGATDRGVMYTCVLTSADNGKYYYRYRKDGDNAWDTVEVSKDEFEWLLTNAKVGANMSKEEGFQGLANYREGNWKAGIANFNKKVTAGRYFNFKTTSKPGLDGQNTYGISQTQLETMVDQNFGAPIVHAVAKGNNLYVLNGEVFLFY